MKRVFESRYAKSNKILKTWADNLPQYSSLFISILALSLSIWSARETRIHDRLSVKPSISFWMPFSPLDKMVEIYLENRGLGPAEVDYTVFLDDTKIDNWNKITYSKYFINDFTLNYKLAAASGSDRRVLVPSWRSISEFTIKSDELVPLYYIEPKYLKSIYDFRDHLESHVVVVGHWCSFYRDCGYVCGGKPLDDDACAKYWEAHEQQTEAAR